MIEVKEFLIEGIEDNSVGIFSHSWTLSGDCYFDSDEELNSFKESLKLLLEGQSPIGIKNIYTNTEIKGEII